MPTLPIALTEPQFVIVGACFAVWAVTLAFFGITRHKFPLGAGGERVVMLVSAALWLGSIGTAIGFAENGPKFGEAAAKEKQKGAAAQQKGAPPPKGPVQALQLAADPTGQLKFDKSTLAAKPGGVKIVMANPSPLSHSVAIQGGGVNVAGKVVPKGQQSIVAATLKPGKYVFYCTVPGHRQAGMQGTLTVK